MHITDNKNYLYKLLLLFKKILSNVDVQGILEIAVNSFCKLYIDLLFLLLKTVK